MTFEIKYYAKPLITPEERTCMNFETAYCISFNNSTPTTVLTSDSHPIKVLGRLARREYLEDLSEIVLINYEDESQNIRKFTHDEELLLYDGFNEKTR